MPIGWFVGRREAVWNRSRSRSKDQRDPEGKCAEYGKGCPDRDAIYGQKCTDCEQKPTEHAGKDEHAGKSA